jgi:hypothetical protein
MYICIPKLPLHQLNFQLLKLELSLLQGGAFVQPQAAFSIFSLNNMTEINQQTIVFKLNLVQDITNLHLGPFLCRVFVFFSLLYSSHQEPLQHPWLGRNAQNKKRTSR